jgi:hypothetical protein
MVNEEQAIQVEKALNLAVSFAKSNDDLHSIRVHLPDGTSASVRMQPDATLKSLLLKACEHRHVDPSVHGMSRMDGSMISSTDLEATTVAQLGASEVITLPTPLCL